MFPDRKEIRAPFTLSVYLKQHCVTLGIFSCSKLFPYHAVSLSKMLSIYTGVMEEILDPYTVFSIATVNCQHYLQLPITYFSSSQKSQICSLLALTWVLKLKQTSILNFGMEERMFVRKQHENWG